MRFDLQHPTDYECTREFLKAEIPILARWIDEEHEVRVEGWSPFHGMNWLEVTSTREGLSFVHLFESPGVKNGQHSERQRKVCRREQWIRCDYVGSGDRELDFLRHVVICDKCLKAIGVDTRQEETAVEWGLKNLVEPWKVLDLLDSSGIAEIDQRRIWDRWYNLTIERREWSEDWLRYDAADYPSKLGTDRRLNDRNYQDYMHAGFSNPILFVREFFESFDDMAKGWSGPRRVSLARMLERVHFLDGRGVPKPEEVASKRSIVQAMRRLRHRRREIVESLTRLGVSQSFSDRGVPFAPRDDRRDPLFEDLL